MRIFLVAALIALGGVGVVRLLPGDAPGAEAAGTPSGALVPATTSPATAEVVTTAIAVPTSPTTDATTSTVPVWQSNGELVQPLESVGELARRGESAGCLRVLPDDAVRVWDWLAVGDDVRVIN